MTCPLADPPTSTEAIRGSADISPNSAATRSKLNRPASPQFSPPTITSNRVTRLMARMVFLLRKRKFSWKRRRPWGGEHSAGASGLAGERDGVGHVDDPVRLHEIGLGDGG